MNTYNDAKCKCVWGARERRYINRWTIVLMYSSASMEKT